MEASKKSISDKILIVIGLIALNVFPYPWTETSNEEPQRNSGQLAKSSDEFPHHASIMMDERHLCSGCLISARDVLTAARCVHRYIPRHTDAIKIIVGTVERPGGTTYEVDKINLHKSYNNSIVKADIAVIRLKKMIALSDSVKIIGLPKAGQKLYVGQQLIASNFGKRMSSQGLLRKIIVYAHNNKLCRKFFDDVDISGKFFALQAYEDHKYLVDIGSPVIANSCTYRFFCSKYVVGIFLYGSSLTHEPGYPYMFTFVPTYLDFIESAIKKEN